MIRKPPLWLWIYAPIWSILTLHDCGERDLYHKVDYSTVVARIPKVLCTVAVNVAVGLVIYCNGIFTCGNPCPNKIHSLLVRSRQPTPQVQRLFKTEEFWRICYCRWCLLCVVTCSVNLYHFLVVSSCKRLAIFSHNERCIHLIHELRRYCHHLFHSYN